MSATFKALVAGFAATPLVLLFTIGLGLATGLNPHYLLVSVLITNIVSIILDHRSTDFYNLGPGIIVLMFSLQNTIGVESGMLSTFILFAIPVVLFTGLSFLPVDRLLLPKRAVAILAFGLGIIIIIKQLPFAFAYSPGDTFFGEGESSFLTNSTVHNWVQLALAFSIPMIALIGRRFKQEQLALILAVSAALGIGYLAGYDSSSMATEQLELNQPFHVKWQFIPDIVYTAIRDSRGISIIMLMSFWGYFSLLHHDQTADERSLKKSLRVVGLGNLVSGLFGVMPANISLMDSLSLRAFGGYGWVSKLPIITILLIVAFIGVPDFNVPIFAFAGVLIYVGILLLLKCWQVLQSLHWVDYLFTFLIGLVLLLTDYTIGFVLALAYALVMMVIIKKQAHKETKLS